MASADVGILGRPVSDGDVWPIDPLDGTVNFAAGTGPFAIVAALVSHGVTVASWLPVSWSAWPGAAPGSAGP